MPSKPKPRPLGHELGPLVYNSKYTRRNGSNTRSNSARSSVNGISSNSPGKHTISLPTREELYTLYGSDSRKNNPKVNGTLKERMQERNLRGASLNDANIQGQVNTRRSLPTRRLGRFGRYSAKNKVNMGSKFVPKDLMIEMDDVFFKFSVRSSNEEEVKRILKNLKEVEDKYLNHFPEEKLEIKKFIRIKYGAYDSFIRKTTIGMFRPFEQDIARAKKELRDSIYHGEPVSKKNEIIDKYINDIRSRFPYPHLPVLHLSLELFIQFKKYSAKEKVNGSNFVPSHRTTKHDSASQPTVAIETNDVKGNTNKVPEFVSMDLMRDIDKVLFDGSKIKVRNDDEEEVKRILNKLEEIEDKYMVTFPEKKRDIQHYLSIKYNSVSTYFYTPFVKDKLEAMKLEAMKEIRNAFYDGRYDAITTRSKIQVIINKYSKDIQSSIKSVGDPIHIRLILEIYYRSLVFSYYRMRTANNVQLSMSRMSSAKNQLRIASESKGVSGRKMVLSNANKQRIALKKPF